MVGAAHTLSEAQDEQLAKLTSCPYPLHEEWASAWDYAKLAGLLGLGEWEENYGDGMLRAIATNTH